MNWNSAVDTNLTGFAGSETDLVLPSRVPEGRSLRVFEFRLKQSLPIFLISEFRKKHPFWLFQFSLLEFVLKPLFMVLGKLYFGSGENFRIINFSICHWNFFYSHNSLLSSLDVKLFALLTVVLWDWVFSSFIRWSRNKQQAIWITECLYGAWILFHTE